MRFPDPSFLHNVDSVYAHVESAPYTATYSHQKGAAAGSDAQCLWYPPVEGADDPPTVLIFVPGNPGLIEFYTEFLSTIHEKHPHIALLGHSHIGHSPGFPKVSVAASGLNSQVEAVLEIYDSIREEYAFDTKVVLAGHSVGAWIVTQVMKARPDAVDGAFLLFPTLSDIAKTPNGRRLSWLFRWPNPIIITILSYITLILPMSLLRSLFSAWPRDQLYVLQALIRSPGTVYSSLTMAHDEMQTIKALDVSVLTGEARKLWIYFAEVDDWVANEKANIIWALRGQEGFDARRIIQCVDQIPHAFVLNHGDIIGARCATWLEEGDFIG